MTNQEYYEELCEKARKYDELLYEYDLLQQEKSIVITKAIKEFAERLKEHAYLDSGITGFQEMVVDLSDIENIADEMVGEDNVE